MNFGRKLVLGTIVSILGLGLVGVAPAAHADSSWGCGGCKVSTPPTGR